MTTTGVDVLAAKAAVLSRAVADLLDTAATSVALTSDDALLDAMRSVETARRQLESFDIPAVAELDRRGLPGKFLIRSTATFVASLFGISPGSAGRRVKHARALGPRIGLTGQPMPPLRPALADAAARGAITDEHVEDVLRALDRLPAHLAVEAVDEAERTLVDAATTMDPRTLAVVARRLIDTLDPDGTLDDRQQRRMRCLTLRPIGDGMVRISGDLDSRAGSLAMTVLHALAAPKPTTDVAGRTVRDERTPGQRMHDGFRAMLAKMVRAGALPMTGGLPATVLITMTAEQFEQRTGLATTSYGDRIRIDEALRLADEAYVAWVVHDSTGAVLKMGEKRRIASASQTRALIARDKGCTFPGCQDPPEWTERHHIVPWRDGGPTDVDNLCMLCDYHHDRIDTEGWQLHMRDGVPWFVPPEWMDPLQQPCRNVRP
jgi:hypothetical protein